MRTLIPIFLIQSALFAAEFPATLRAIPVASGLGALTQITNAGDGSGRLFIVRQNGVISILKDGRVSNTPFLTITNKVICCNERGLLSVSFPPGFATKQYFYVNYTDRPNGNTVVARYRVTSNPDVADPASEQVLLTVVQPYENHNGGMTAFSPRDGQLYVGMGDGGSGGDPQNNAQNDNSHLGKMLRLDTEANLNATPTPQHWAKGLRNPWRFTFDRETQDLWIADVGQGTYEEIDVQPASTGAGVNYGWQRMEGNHCYDSNCSMTGLTLPIFEYDHSAGDCSVTGGYVYRGLRYPALRGVYFFADYCTGKVWATRASGSGFETRRITQFNGLNITSFGEDEQGEHYFVTGDGRVYLLATDPPTATAAGVVNAASYQRGISPGSIASVFGLGLTTVNGIQNAPALPLGTSLSGTTLTLNGTAVPIFAVADVKGQEQINFQVPWELAGASTATLVVSNNGTASAPVEVALSAVNPGIFAVVRGDTFATIYATGLGPVENRPATGSAPGGARNLITLPRVTIGGREAVVTYAGLAPSYVGLYQINVNLPAGAAAGDDVVIIAGGVSSNAGKL